MALNTTIGLMKDMGRPRGDMREVALWQDVLTVNPKGAYYTYQVYNEAIVIPENVDAIRALAGTTTNGREPIPVTVKEPYFSRVEQSIEAVRAAGADLVVFSIHWGPNMRHVPPQEFKEFARAVMDAGADVFHGHSAHIFQRIDIYERKPILYDTGDLIDDYYVDVVHKKVQQFLFLVTATGSGVERIELVPVLISNAQVNTAHRAVLDQIHERMQELSAAMGTEVRRKGDHLLIDVTKQGSR